MEKKIPTYLVLCGRFWKRVVLPKSLVIRALCDTLFTRSMVARIELAIGMNVADALVSLPNVLFGENREN